MGTFVYGKSKENTIQRDTDNQKHRKDLQRHFIGLQAAERLAQEALCRLGVPCRREIKVDGVAAFVDCPVEIGLLDFNLDVGLIDPPAA